MCDDSRMIINYAVCDNYVTSKYLCHVKNLNADANDDLLTANDLCNSSISVLYIAQSGFHIFISKKSLK